MQLSYTQALQKFNNIERVAVCISGDLNHYEDTINSLLSYIPNADYFIHLNTDNIDEANKVIERLNPKKYEISKIEDVEVINKNQSITNQIDLIKIKSFYISSQLKKKFEIENNFIYDVVIKTDFTVRINKTILENVTKLKRNTFYGNNFTKDLITNNGGVLITRYMIDFKFWYSDSVTFNYISNFLRYLPKITTRFIDQNTDLKHTWLHFIKKNDIEIIELQNTITHL